MTLHATGEELAELFDLDRPPVVPPRYNVAPSQLLAVIGLKADDMTRSLVPMSWGFVPHWANDPSDGPKPVNAKSETVLANGAFRESARRKRCVIPASGFYEWATVSKRKIPHYFTATDGKPFAFAGLYDGWTDENGKVLHTCCILTTTANEVVGELYDRMPVILPRATIGHWLDRHTDTNDALSLCVPYPAQEMQSVVVSTYVNKATNEGEECIRAVA